MKECERLIGELPVLDYYNINSIAAEEQGFRKGWRAALEWAKQLYKDEVIGGSSNRLYLYRKKIEQELEDIDGHTYPRY